MPPRKTMTHDEHKNIYQTIAETIVRADTQLTSKEVQAGAARLDRIHPGWYNKIDLKRFDIRSGTECVMGHLYGDYNHDELNHVFRLRKQFQNHDSIETRLDRLSEQHGFVEGQGTPSYTTLQKNWVKAIKTRQQAHAALTK